MGNNDILIPGMPADIEESKPVTASEEYLKIVNALSEIKESGDLSFARKNLGVYGTTEVEEMVNGSLHVFLDKLDNLKQIIESNASDNQESYDQLTSLLENLSTKEETNTLKQELLNTLTTKLKSYLTSKQIDERIVESLVDYVTSSQVYKKEDVYTKGEIDKSLKNYVKTDGSTPFTSTQQGVYPKIRKDLATKGYSDDCMKNHKNEADPHNYTSILNNKLNNYYKKSEVYTKAQTYDRTTIDSLIDKLVRQACDSLIEEHINVTPHLTSQDILRIIKNYASENLLSNDELQRELNNVLETINEEIGNVVWKTSGPVETTVGFVEDNSEVPSEMTLQDIMDAIFYGKGISLSIPDDVNMGDLCEITVCIHGSLALVESAILYQNGKIFKEFTPEEFENGCVTITSDSIYEDTEFKFDVTYTNGTELEESKTITCSLPIFIGSLPKWKFANTITWDYLKELENLNLGIFTNASDTSYDFNFTDASLRHPFIVVPFTNPILETMTTKSQSFTIEAFDIIDVIPLQIPGAKKEIIYKIYVYRLALSSLNLKVTFNFSEK